MSPQQQQQQLSLQPHPSLNASTPARDVPFLLGQLTSNDRILFTKASLIGFLKSHGVEVETDLRQLKGVVKWAEVARVQEAPAHHQQQQQHQHQHQHQQQGGAEVERNVANAPAATTTVRTQSDFNASAPAPPTAAASTRASVALPEIQSTSNSMPASTYAGDQHIQHNPAVRDAAGDAFKPTRRVRELIGGGSAQISALFGDDDSSAPRHAQAQAPLRTNSTSNAGPVAASSPAYNNNNNNNNDSNSFSPSTTPSHETSSFQPNKGVVDAEGHAFRPTRRVREAIGGGSEQIASLFGGEENVAPRRR